MLTRSKPMKRTAMKRRPKRVRAGDPKRSGTHLDYVRGLGCVWGGTLGPGLLRWVSGVEECGGRIEASHHGIGDRGTGTKASDYTCIPLCTRHHREFTEHGRLGNMDGEQTRDWACRVAIGICADRLRAYDSEAF